MNLATLKIEMHVDETRVKALYEAYGNKLHSYTCRNFKISPDEAWDIVYRTIYKIASLDDSVVFDNEHKKAGYIFRTHVNFLKNFFRDDKTFENRNYGTELDENLVRVEETQASKPSAAMIVLQEELAQLKDWERILLHLRSQDLPYSHIAPLVNRPEKHLKVYYARLKKELLDKVNKKLNALNKKPNDK